MLLPLVCPCLQENMRRNSLCKEIVNFTKLIVPIHVFGKVFFVVILAALVMSCNSHTYNRNRAKFQK